MKSDPGQILACPGVNLDLVPLVDEQRDEDLCPCLHGSRLRRACRRIALEAGLCVGNLEFYE